MWLPAPLDVRDLRRYRSSKCWIHAAGERDLNAARSCRAPAGRREPDTGSIGSRERDEETEHSLIFVRSPPGRAQKEPRAGKDPCRSQQEGWFTSHRQRLFDFSARVARMTSRSLSAAFGAASPRGSAEPTTAASPGHGEGQAHQAEALADVPVLKLTLSNREDRSSI
jgi:hypothetical protein